MRSSIGSWTFGPIEQGFARVSSARYTDIDLTATAHSGRWAAPPGQGMQGDGGGEELEALELELIAKRDTDPVAQLEASGGRNLGREAKP